MFKRYLYRNYHSAGALTRKLDRRMTNVGRLVVLGTLVAAALGMDTTASMAYQTFSFLGCLVLVALLGLIWSGRRVEVKRVMPKFGTVGQPMPYTLIVKNRSRRIFRSLTFLEDPQDPRPTYEQFANTPEPGEEKRNAFDRLFGVYRWRWLVNRNRHLEVREVTLPDLPPGGEMEIQTELIPLRRGVGTLRGAWIGCPEPMGLFRTMRRVNVPQSVLILPKRYRMPPFNMPGTTQYQQGGVSMASSVGESEEFISLRDYRPGDPLRRLHWKSSAKAGRLIVKEYQDEFFVRHALVLDTFTHRPFSGVFEEAVSVAASLAYTLQDHDSLLDLMFVGLDAYCFTSGRGVGQIERILEILASVEACEQKEFQALETLVTGHLSSLSGCLCVFLDWDESRQKFVRLLQSRQIPLKVFVITEGESVLPPGPMALEPENFHCLPCGKVEERLAQL
jgi:uncharacterized protein (DUF58 family)